jgi:hypothetical protein
MQVAASDYVKSIQWWRRRESNPRVSLGHNSGTRKPAAPVENARATREGGVLLKR